MTFNIVNFQNWIERHCILQHQRYASEKVIHTLRGNKCDRRFQWTIKLFRMFWNNLQIKLKLGTTLAGALMIHVLKLGKETIKIKIKLKYESFEHAWSYRSKGLWFFQRDDWVKSWCCSEGMVAKKQENGWIGNIVLKLNNLNIWWRYKYI